MGATLTTVHALFYFPAGVHVLELAGPLLERVDDGAAKDAGVDIVAPQRRLRKALPLLLAYAGPALLRVQDFDETHLHAVVVGLGFLHFPDTSDEGGNVLGVVDEGSEVGPPGVELPHRVPARADGKVRSTEM